MEILILSVFFIVVLIVVIMGISDFIIYIKRRLKKNRSIK